MVILGLSQVLQHEEVPAWFNPKGSICYLMGGVVDQHGKFHEECGHASCHQTMDSW